MKKKKIFLSHSGIDKNNALEVSQKLKKFLDPFKDFVLEVFNTSDCQFRYKAFKDKVANGKKNETEYSKWKNELREYLRNNLLNSDIYLLLTTNRSILESSGWILFEMETAQKEALIRKGPFFFPCLYAGASYDQLPEIASEFQAADINSDEGLFTLAYQLYDFFQEETNE